MNHHIGKRLVVSLLVVAVTIGVLSRRFATAMEEGTLQAQAGATETKSRDRNSVAEKAFFGPVIERPSHFTKLLPTEAAQSVKEPSRQFQVIHLQHLESRDILETLKQLELIGENLLAAAPKSNLLVLRGDPLSIEEALALIKLLDSPPRAANVGQAQAGGMERQARGQQADGDPSFEWVYERVINHSADNTNDYFLDLDTGKFVKAPVSIFALLRTRFDGFTKLGRRDETINSWARNTGADLTVGFTAPDVTLSLYGGAIFFPLLSFEAAKADDVMKVANDAAKKRKAEGKTLNSLPPLTMFHRPSLDRESAFVFQTREGGIGILQIASSTEEPRSVTVRYKLLSGGTDDATSTSTASSVEGVKALKVGDQVTHQPLAEGPSVPNRQPQNNPNVQSKQEVPTGVLSGRFVYDGEPPVAEDLYPSFAKLTLDTPQQRGPDGRFSGVEALYRTYLKHNIRPTTTDQSLRVDKDKGVADVVISVVSKDIPWSPPAEEQSPVAIEIKDASFSPRATVVIAGQSVLIENQDPVAQSVSAMFSRALNPPSNVRLKAEASHRVVFPVPEPFPAKISLQHCPWATGLLFVHSDPYVAISQEDGSFRIPNLPPGEWEFQVWHERIGFVPLWPKGRFTLKINPGDNRLGVVKLQPEQFVAAAIDDAAPLIDE